MRQSVTAITSGVVLVGAALAACRTEAAGPVVNNDLFADVRLVAPVGTFTDPSSAIPDAAGQFVYFIARRALGGGAAGVFKVPATGGTVTEVFVGAPFVAPSDLAMSTDNFVLYVADSLAGGTGRIYAVSIGGGLPAEVPGTAGTAPVALDARRVGGEDRLYYAGTSAADGLKAVFEIPAAGAGAPTIRHKGGALVAPSGVAASPDGVLFVADAGSRPDAGVVYELTFTGMGALARGIRMGSPAGIAHSPSLRFVTVSSERPSDGTAQVHVVDLNTGHQSVFNRVIGANRAPGGLHGARNETGALSLHAWAGRTTGVYLLEP